MGVRHHRFCVAKPGPRRVGRLSDQAPRGTDDETRFGGTSMSQTIKALAASIALIGSACAANATTLTTLEFGVELTSSSVFAGAVPALGTTGTLTFAYQEVPGVQPPGLNQFNYDGAILTEHLMLDGIGSYSALDTFGRTPAFTGQIIASDGTFASGQSLPFSVVSATTAQRGRGSITAVFQDDDRLFLPSLALQDVAPAFRSIDRSVRLRACGCAL